MNMGGEQPAFGTVVLESDLDMDPAAAYRAYGERWVVEVSMRYYKSTLELGETRVHDGRSVIGSEFCDFLVTVITWQLVRTSPSGIGMLQALWSHRCQPEGQAYP